MFLLTQSILPLHMKSWPKWAQTQVLVGEFLSNKKAYGHKVVIPWWRLFYFGGNWLGVLGEKRDAE